MVFLLCTLTGVAGFLAGHLTAQVRIVTVDSNGRTPSDIVKYCSLIYTGNGQIPGTSYRIPGTEPNATYAVYSCKMS
jgi:hypothetical protein